MSFENNESIINENEETFGGNNGFFNKTIICSVNSFKTRKIYLNGRIVLGCNNDLFAKYSYEGRVLTILSLGKKGMIDKYVTTKFGNVYYRYTITIKFK